ncbi:twin-arginine translocase subunit TatC [Microbacterium gorillae]|uniref:twin-arginine translocase subunit TatC n=1 Tax=Microbacterium gorillae TaxID=1231063 RepID=UPI001E411ED8|nr:twin-arginine translocase subunit TatC [Microbacterium gorillae]
MTADPQPAEEGTRNDKRMTLWEHLRELRRRVMICAAVLLVFAIAAFIVTKPVLEFITLPLELVKASREAAGATGTTSIVLSTVTGPFDLRMKIAFTMAFFASAPVWLWQIWAFIMPAMTRREKGYTIGFTAAAIPLFFGGCAVAFWITPHIIELMASFLPEQFDALYDGVSYYDFVFKLMLIIGISFVLPLFLVALNLAGVMSGRTILKGWRWAVIIATVFSAITTPAADITSMLMLAGILVVLYFAAATLSLLFDRRKRKREAAILPPAAAEPAT